MLAVKLFDVAVADVVRNVGGPDRTDACSRRRAKHNEVKRLERTRTVEPLGVREKKTDKPYESLGATGRTGRKQCLQ